MTAIAIIVGSTRAGSLNRILAEMAAHALRGQGASVTQVDLADFDLPLYSEAVEAKGFPADAQRLKQVLARQQGLLVVTPEFNGSVPPALKNLLDWASRPTGDEAAFAFSAYRGKAAAMMSASPSPFGGLRGLMHLRQILTTVQMLVIPEQLALPNAHLAFDDAEQVKDALTASLIDLTALRLVAVARALAA